MIVDAEHWLCRNKIAIIDVEGMILNARTSGLFGGGDNPMSLFRERLDAAADDPHVKAVVLRINSPGGAVTASDIMYQDVLSFRRDTGKPVVACMMDVAASGAFYLAMGCDRVYAHPTTVTGQHRRDHEPVQRQRPVREDRRDERSHQVRPEQGHRQPGAADDAKKSGPFCKGW